MTKTEQTRLKTWRLKVLQHANAQATWLARADVSGFPGRLFYKCKRLRSPRRGRFVRSGSDAASVAPGHAA